MQPVVNAFFHQPSGTFSYVVSDGIHSDCAIIDPVLDFDHKSGRTSTPFADEIVDYIQEQGLEVVWILETHAHADHLSAARYLQEKLGGKIAIGVHITQVQETFKEVFNLPELTTDGRQFDRLLAEGDHFTIGDLTGEVLHTPGHTPGCSTLVIGEAAFVGDTLFMPDKGTARCDFPGGDARTLYRSIQKILALPPHTRLYMCHDYPPDSRGPEYLTTVEEQRRHNIHVGNAATEEDFVALRTERDAQLDMPLLILPSIQVNIRAGSLPEPEDNGVVYLKIPLNRL